MKLKLFLLLTMLVTASLIQAQEEPEELVSFNTVKTAVLRVFPEAYEQFLTVSFTFRSGYIYPETTSFLVPAKHFKKKLTQKELDHRTEILIDQLELAPACQSISVGDPENYNWQEWEDRHVCKVTITFGIGC